MKLSAIDTHLVVALHALLEERSVTRAARRTGVTQSTMSHALSRLRACFDDPLLVAEGRGMVPTARALALAGPAAAAIAGLEAVFAAPAAFDPRKDARAFRVAATDNLELLVLPRLARMFAREAPRVDVRVRALSADWAGELRRGELDLKLGRRGPDAPGLVRETLASESLVCVVRRGHPALAKRMTVKRYAALDHLLVAPHGGEVGAVDRALAAHGMRRRVAMTVPHFLVAPFVVARSDLILTAPSRVAAALGPALSLVTLPCPVELPSYALEMSWAERASGDPAAAWLRACVRRVFGDG